MACQAINGYGVSQMSSTDKCIATAMKCENQALPIGIDKRRPGFSWLFTQAGRNRKQSAYRILVSSSYRRISHHVGDMWDSGKVLSPATNLVRYGGKPLAGKTRYYWKVMVWDSEGHNSRYSRISTFETSLFHKDDWKACWIGGFDLLRKEFTIRKQVLQARLYATGLGYHEIYLNGKKTNDQVLSPSFTDYKKHIEYIVSDVTASLQNGFNAIGVMLGSGWYLNGWFGGEKRALVQLDIAYADGSSEIVISDGSWMGSSGPIVKESIFDGEIYDARLEQQGWNLPGFRGTGWMPVKELAEVEADLVPQMLPPIRVINEIKPIAVNKVHDQSYVADFGLNMAGWVRISVRGSKGDKVTMRYGELLHPDGSVDMTTNLLAKATDIYILKGTADEVYEPRFTYHGFRYVEVGEYPGTPGIDSFMACVVHSDVKEISGFKCSGKQLNLIHEIMKRTLSNNLHSIPTDCCQRNERLGWMADAFAASEACLYNFDMHQFYKKWLEDIRDAQNPDTGELMSTVAPYIDGRSYVTWNAAYPIMVHHLYQYFGDVEAVESHYTHLKKMFSFFESIEDDDGLIRTKPHPVFRLDFADWLSIKVTQPHQVDNCFYYKIADLMCKLAGALGQKDDESYYLAKAEKIKSTYNKNYLHPVHKGSGFYNSLDRISQTGNALPLCFGMVPDAWREKVGQNLIWDVADARGSAQMTTGILGTKYLTEYLAETGQAGILYDLFSRSEYPGWGYMLKRGATTVWERWEYMRADEMNSHDHPALASPDTLFWRTFAGISWPVSENGIRVFTFKPFLSGQLQSAEGFLDTPWGKANIKWRIENGQLSLKLHVPANSAGRLYIKYDGSDGTVIEVGSGTYEYLPDHQAHYSR
jgi:alpha-L-rhamnosidase